MDIEELKNSYYFKKIDMKNVVIQLENAIMYLEYAKQYLQDSYKINGELAEDENITNILTRALTLKDYINETIIPHIETEENAKAQELEQL